jgi:hypothetical protein
VKNKTNDPAAVIHPRDRWMPWIQSRFWDLTIEKEEIIGMA